LAGFPHSKPLERSALTVVCEIFSGMPKNSPLLRVLVVDDESLLRWSIAESLTDAGHTVIEAGDGATALTLLARAPEWFDVVLLDYRLPDSNDLNLLANVRQQSPHSAVVLMTAFGTADVITGARKLGVAGVLNKPFDMHVVGRAVIDAAGV
jgi:two-component system response regulator AtoC